MIAVTGLSSSLWAQFFNQELRAIYRELRCLGPVSGNAINHIRRAVIVSSRFLIGSPTEYNDRFGAIPVYDLAEIQIHSFSAVCINGRDCRHYRPKKYLLAVGGAVFLCGIILLSKVLNKVYFDSRFNINVALCGFFSAAIFVWLGMGIILWALGLLI